LTFGGKITKLARMHEVETRINTLLTSARFHKRLYGSSQRGPGEYEDEGIHQRVRQGVRGPTELVVGADVIGHYHRADVPYGQYSGYQGPNAGDTIEVPDLKGNWHRVRLHTRANHECYSQEDEDEMGFYFDGVIVSRRD